MDFCMMACANCVFNFSEKILKSQSSRLFMASREGQISPLAFLYAR